MYFWVGLQDIKISHLSHRFVSRVNSCSLQTYIYVFLCYTFYHVLLLERTFGRLYVYITVCHSNTKRCDCLSLLCLRVLMLPFLYETLKRRVNHYDQIRSEISMSYDSYVYHHCFTIANICSRHKTSACTLRQCYVVCVIVYTTNDVVRCRMVFKLWW